jgi:hypothetical protein
VDNTLAEFPISRIFAAENDTTLNALAIANLTDLVKVQESRR